MTTVFLGLGSNLGDRKRNIAQAVGLLSQQLSIRKLSMVYETDPVGVTEQPRFLNVVVEGATQSSPRELLATTQEIERRVGRRPTFRWGPRVIDIDILLYGDQTINEADLITPHPRMRERKFVLVPLCEIAPDASLPDGSPICGHELETGDDEASVRAVGPLNVARFFAGPDL